MLRLAPTLSAAAVLAVMLAAAAPAGAGMLLKVISTKDHNADRHNDARLMKQAVPDGRDAAAIVTNGTRALLRWLSYIGRLLSFVLAAGACRTFRHGSFDVGLRSGMRALTTSRYFRSIS